MSVATLYEAVICSLYSAEPQEACYYLYTDEKKVGFYMQQQSHKQKSLMTYNMNKKEFLAQYQDKRWYELSKRIKARDKNTCQMCGSNDRPVSVHHKVYHKGASVWDYSDNELICICDDCHKTVTEKGKQMYEDYCRLKQSFREFGFSDIVLCTVFAHLESLLEIVISDRAVYDDESKNFLSNIIFGTQDYNDLKVLKRLGVYVPDLVKSLYPNLYEDYIKTD